MDIQLLRLNDRVDVAPCILAKSISTWRRHRKVVKQVMAFLRKTKRNIDDDRTTCHTEVPWLLL